VGKQAVKPIAALKGRSGVVLDTMVFIYLFEDHKRYAPVCESLVEWMESGVFLGMVTPITMAELIVKPLKAGRPDMANRYRAVMDSLKNLECSTIDTETGWMAGALRAKYGLALPDMLQVASALRAEEPTLVSNDRALQRVEELQLILLDDLVS
jgi:predicted nucleic acid-binding protein